MNPLKFVKDTVNHVFWGLMFQGVAFVALAVAIFIYPELLTFIFIVIFLLLGTTLLVLAWKVRSFWNKVPKIFK